MNSLYYSHNRISFGVHSNVKQFPKRHQMLVILAPRISGMTTHSSLWPPQPLPPTQPWFISAPYDWAQGVRVSFACPVQRSLPWGTPSWGRFTCLGALPLGGASLVWLWRIFRWRSWAGESSGTGGSHQTPEANVCTRGVSVPPGPKVKVS